MFRPRIIPVLLLKNNGLVKTTNFKDPNYIGDPMNAVRIFNEFEADELVILDIDATKENRTISKEIVHQIAEEAYMPFAIGGGINTIDQIKDILGEGVEKVVLNTSAYKNPQLIEEASMLFGRQSIVVSIDVKKDSKGNYKILVEGGEKEIEYNLIDYLKRVESLGAGEIMINSIDRDGEMLGYDLELIKIVSENVSIPVIACGGAGNLEDFSDVTNIGKASAAAAGSYFVYIGKNKGILINYPDSEDFEEIFN